MSLKNTLISLLFLSLTSAPMAWELPPLELPDTDSSEAVPQVQDSGPTENQNEALPPLELPESNDIINEPETKSDNLPERLLKTEPSDPPQELPPLKLPTTDNPELNPEIELDTAPPVELPALTLPGIEPGQEEEEALVDIPEKPTFNPGAPSEYPEVKVPQKRSRENTAPLPLRHHYFKVYQQGKLIGWAGYKVSRSVALEGQNYWHLSSIIKLKQDNESLEPLEKKVSSIWAINRGMSASYSHEQSNLTGRAISAENIIAQKKLSRRSIDENKKGRTLELDLVDPHIIPLQQDGVLSLDSLIMLIQKAPQGGPVASFSMDQEKLGTLYLSTPKKDGAHLAYTVYDFDKRPYLRVWYNPSQRSLYRVSEYGNGLTYVRTNGPLPLSEVETHWTQTFSYQSNLNSPENYLLQSLEANITGHFRGKPITEHHTLGFDQQFYGELNNDGINGQVKVSALELDFNSEESYPFTDELPTEITSYLEPLSTSDIRQPYISRIANKSGTSIGSLVEAVLEIAGEFELQPEQTYRQSFESILKERRYNKTSRNTLVAGLLRDSGVPARTIQGIQIQGKTLVPTTWTELWTPEQGWVMLDSEAGSFGHKGANRIAVLESGVIQDWTLNTATYEPSSLGEGTILAGNLNPEPGSQISFEERLDETTSLRTETLEFQDLSIDPVTIQDVLHYHFQQKSHPEAHAALQKEGSQDPPEPRPEKNQEFTFGILQTGDSNSARLKEPNIKISFEDGSTQTVNLDTADLTLTPTYKKQHFTYQDSPTLWSIILEQLPDNFFVSYDTELKISTFDLYDQQAKMRTLKLVDPEYLVLPDGTEFTAHVVEVENGTRLYLDSDYKLVRLDDSYYLTTWYRIEQ